MRKTTTPPRPDCPRCGDLVLYKAIVAIGKRIHDLPAAAQPHAHEMLRAVREDQDRWVREIVSKYQIRK